MAQAYQQTNLVSDIQGLAQNPPSGQADTQLLNPWGLVDCRSEIVTADAAFGV
jgi:hypothetical protein